MRFANADAFYNNNTESKYDSYRLSVGFIKILREIIKIHNTRKENNICVRFCHGPIAQPKRLDLHHPPTMTFWHTKQY
jgi:hypothetical protein